MLDRSSTRAALLTLALILAFISQANQAFAGTLGSIAGTVSDAKSGAPLAGVRLKVTSPSQAASVTTDARGHFLVFSLQPDNYTITAEKDGYETTSVSGYAVYADQTQQYDLQLTPAATPPPP